MQCLRRIFACAVAIGCAPVLTACAKGEDGAESATTLAGNVAPAETTSRPPDTIPLAPLLPVSDSVIEVSAGEAHVCAVTTRGVAYCWGDNAGHALGTGGDQVREPTRVKSALRFRAVAAGGSFTCALDLDGAAHCWGQGLEGQMGNGQLSGGSETPAPVVGDRRYTQIVAGAAHVCALDAAGTAWCWGWNEYGQLGDGTTQSSGSPVRVKLDKPFTRLGASLGSTTCGVTADSLAFCWGADGGRLGGPTSSLGTSTPVQIAGVSRVVSVSVGGSTACDVDAEGSALCWGRNAAGALGVGKEERELAVSAAPVRVQADVPFTSIVAHMAKTCAIARDSSLYCWGAIAYGLAGGVRGANRPTLVEGGIRWRQIAIGGQGQYCGASVDGRLYCWGTDLGPEPTQPDVTSPRAITLK